MRILEDIAKNYRELFNRTGKIEFFMRAKNVERLNNDIMGINKQIDTSQETELSV